MKATLFTAFMILVGSLAGIGIIHLVECRAVFAQERDPATQTKWWDIPIGGWADVRVVETTGVCLYVYAINGKPSIAAVPKTQLRPGVGCQ